MILEKIPERLLAPYYRWLDENKHRGSLETLKDWVSEEATYQIQATEIRAEFQTQITMNNYGIVSIVILEDSLEATSATRTEEAIKTVVYVLGTTHC